MSPLDLSTAGRCGPAARPLRRPSSSASRREWLAQAATAGPDAVLFRFRRDFLQRRAAKTKLPEDAAGDRHRAAEAAARSSEGLFPELPWAEDPELATSRWPRWPARSRERLPGGPPAEEDARGRRGRPRARPHALSGPDFASRFAPPPADDSDEALLVFLDRPRPNDARGAASGPAAPAAARRRRSGSPSISPRPWTTAPWSKPSARSPALPGEPTGPRRPAAAAGGLRADRPAHDAPRGPRPDALLPALPRAREGLLLEGALRAEDGDRPEEPARNPAAGLPARREDLRDAPAAARRRLDRRAGARLPRQPDVPRAPATASATTA